MSFRGTGCRRGRRDGSRRRTRRACDVCCAFVERLEEPLVGDTERDGHVLARRAFAAMRTQSQFRPPETHDGMVRSNACERAHRTILLRVSEVLGSSGIFAFATDVVFGVGGGLWRHLKNKNNTETRYVRPQSCEEIRLVISIGGKV